MHQQNETLTFAPMPTRFPSVHPLAVVIALPVVPIVRTLWYMEGETWSEKLEYFLYVVSEGWPFWLAYLVAVFLISRLFREGGRKDVLDN